jgi:hypothetical protein
MRPRFDVTKNLLNFWKFEESGPCAYLLLKSLERCVVLVHRGKPAAKIYIPGHATAAQYSAAAQVWRLGKILYGVNTQAHDGVNGSSSCSYSYLLPPSKKKCNYVLRASKSSLRLTKFLANTIHIYGSKIIYYKNTFRN